MEHPKNKAQLISDKDSLNADLAEDQQGDINDTDPKDLPGEEEEEEELEDDEELDEEDEEEEEEDEDEETDPSDDDTDEQPQPPKNS